MKITLQAAALFGIMGLSSLSTAPGFVSSAAAAPEGTFVIATDFLSEEVFDPGLSPGSARFYFHLLYDDLVGASDLGRPSQDRGIAKEWVIAPDGKSVTYTLHEGLKFQDGSTLTSEDVKFSIERVLHPDSRSSYAGALRGLIDRVEAPDPTTLVVYNKEPSVLPIEYLGPTSTEGVVVPKAYVERVGEEEFRRNPVGSGPYRLVEHRLGSAMVFEAAPVHSGLRAPTKERVIFNLVPEESSRKALLRTGEADIINVGRDSAVELRDEGYPIISRPSELQIEILMHLQANGEPISDAYPISDVRVRRAMSLAINRTEIADVLFRGFAKPTTAFRTFGPVLQSVGASHADFADDYDPDQARQLLEEAGYPERWPEHRRIDFYLHARPGVGEWEDLGALLADYWRAIGLEINLRVGDYSVWRDRWTAQELPGAVAFLTVPSGTSWVDQLIGYRSFMMPELPRALMWDMAMRDMLLAVDQAGQTDPEEAARRLRDIAAYSYENYAPGFSIVDVDSTYAISKELSPWTPRLREHSFGDIEQVLVE